MKYLGTRFVVGFFVLLPVILSYLLFGALLETLMSLTIPFTDLMPLSWFAGDVVTEGMAAVVLLIALCITVGILQQSAAGKRIGAWIERQVLARFTPYEIVRNLSRRLSGKDVPNKLEPALLSIRPGAKMFAYIVEEHAADQLTVFVPMGSTPWAGQIQIVSRDNVERLAVPMLDTLDCLFNWGAGTEALLKKHARR